ncbi:hypothetical protein ACFL21_01190 [Patescibacteria group bacterium]
MPLNTSGGALAEPLITTRPAENQRKEVSPLPCPIEQRISATADHILNRVLKKLDIPLAGTIAKRMIRRKLRHFAEGLTECDLSEKHLPIVINELWRLFSVGGDLKDLDSSKIRLDRKNLQKDAGSAFSTRDWMKMEKFLRYAIMRLKESSTVTNKAAKKVRKHLKERLPVEGLGAKNVGDVGVELWKNRSRI